MENNTILGQAMNTTQDLEQGHLTVTAYSCKVYRFIMSVGITRGFWCFGIVGYILTLMVFSRFNQNSSDRKSRSSAPLLLSGLALSDISLLLTFFVMKYLPSFISPEFFTNHSFAFLMVYGWPCVGVAQSVNTLIVLVT